MQVQLKPIFTLCRVIDNLGDRKKAPLTCLFTVIHKKVFAGLFCAVHWIEPTQSVN